MHLSLMLALSLLPNGLEPLDNFMENPSFEEDRNRDDLPDGWKAHAFESAGSTAWDDSTARTGERSLRISDPGRSDSRDWKKSATRWSSATRPVEPGSDYSLEVWVKTQGVTGRAVARLSWQKGGRWLDEVKTAEVTGTADWQKLSLEAKAPAEADGASIVLELGYGDGTVWFDDVKASGRSEPIPKVEYVFNDTEDWFPFEFSLNDTNLDALDLTRFVERPAGAHGFVSVHDDGHFHFADGKRARFFGTNLGGRDVSPPKERAPALAARFAKFGVNMIRLHAFDSTYSGILDYSRGTTQEFNAEGLDRMDYLVSELKKQGIYVYLDLLDYRRFTSADGVKHGDDFTHNWAGSMKGASIFDERMIELQKDYATKLLTHRNPYTKLRYVEDPAIAVVEITNENSLFYFLLNKDLSLPYYREQLALRWNAWLVSRYRNRAGVIRAWTDAGGECELFDSEDPAEKSVKLPAAELTRFSKGLAADRNKLFLGPARTRDGLEFLGELQHHYYQQIRGHLKEKLGVRVPITGTNQVFVLTDTAINAQMSDFIARNQYWHHPSVQAKPFFKFANVPMLQSDVARERGPLTVFASSSVVGKPLVLAEFNFPWPNEYRCEGLLTSTAYACLQDWDAVLLFSFALDEGRLAMFRSQTDPARWGEFPAAALMFHRHDVATARNEVHVVHIPEDTATYQPDERYAPYTNFRYLTFLSKVRQAFVADSYRGAADVVLACGASADAVVKGDSEVIRLAQSPWEEWLYPKFVEAAQKLKLPGYEEIDPSVKRFESDTGQLSLNYDRGLLTINSPRTKGAVGFLAGAGRLDLDGLSLASGTNFGAVIATSLDDQPIGRSRHVLLTAVARAENTSQGFWPSPHNPTSWSPYTTWMLPGEGRPPVIAEPVRAAIRMQFPGAATIHALDETGKRRRAVPAKTDGDMLQLDLDTSQARSIWIEIAAE